MTIRTIIIVRWAAIGFAAGFVVFVFLITTERPLPSCAALIPQGVGIVTLGTVGGFGLGFCRSRSVPANAADDAGVSQLYTLSLALALLIFSCIAAIFMSLGTAKEAGPSKGDAIAPAGEMISPWGAEMWRATSLQGKAMWTINRWP
jgi:hypothetical protein